MQKKTISPAVWFIPLVAVVLASVCLFCWFVGKALYKQAVKQAQPPVAQAVPVKPAQPAPVPVIPFETPEETEPALPPEVAEAQAQDNEGQAAVEDTAVAPEICPATSVPVKIEKPKRMTPTTPFKQGLQQCMAGRTFPCAWEDNSQGVIKQYWLLSATGPVERGVYDMGGNLLHETQATLGGTVTHVTRGNTTWYFEGGVLAKIRTTPYDNCNFHDWFYINAAGKQDVCQCTYNQPDCCARSPYKEGDPRGYCEIYPQDKDFCK